MGVVPLRSIIYGDGFAVLQIPPLPWNLRVVVRFVRARQSASARHLGILDHLVGNATSLQCLYMSIQSSYVIHRTRYIAIYQILDEFKCVWRVPCIYISFNMGTYTQSNSYSEICCSCLIYMLRHFK